MAHYGLCRSENFGGEDYDFRVFLMIELRGEDFPLPIKIQTPSRDEDKSFGHDLSVSFNADKEQLTFRFTTGFFATTEKVYINWWDDIKVIENQYGQEEVELTLHDGAVKQYKVCKYDQTGSYITECRHYWNKKHKVAYERESDNELCRENSWYSFTPKGEITIE